MRFRGKKSKENTVKTKTKPKKEEIYSLPEEEEEEEPESEDLSPEESPEEEISKPKRRGGKAKTSKGSNRQKASQINEDSACSEIL